MNATPTREQVLDLLNEVPDPEVPVISVVELGIVRDVEVSGSAVTVVITPTYSGCPAMRTIEEDIARMIDSKREVVNAALAVTVTGKIVLNAFQLVSEPMLLALAATTSRRSSRASAR